MITASLDGTIRYWNVEEETARITTGMSISSFLVAKRGGKTYLVVHSSEAERVVWFDAETRAEVARFDGAKFHRIAHGDTYKMVEDRPGCYSSVDLGIPPFIQGVDAEMEPVAGAVKVEL